MQHLINLHQLTKASEVPFTLTASGFSTAGKSVALICHPSEKGNLRLWVQNQHILLHFSSKKEVFLFLFGEENQVNPYQCIKKDTPKS